MRNVYGADYTKNSSPWPHTADENRRLFNDVGGLLQRSFLLANKLGIKTCIGTETPLAVPQMVQQKFLQAPQQATTAQLSQQLYEGMFTRIKALHQLDYYWLWTPEKWTWEGNNDAEVEATRADFSAAIAAAKK